MEVAVADDDGLEAREEVCLRLGARGAEAYAKAVPRPAEVHGQEVRDEEEGHGEDHRKEGDQKVVRGGEEGYGEDHRKEVDRMVVRGEEARGVEGLDEEARDVEGLEEEDGLEAEDAADLHDLVAGVVVAVVVDNGMAEEGEDGEEDEEGTYGFRRCGSHSHRNAASRDEANPASAAFDASSPFHACGQGHDVCDPRHGQPVLHSLTDLRGFRQQRRLVFRTSASTDT